MLNVGLAGVAGGTMAFLHYVLFHADQSRIARALGGFVSGLVAIAACAQSVTFAEAIVIGAVAGLLQNIGFSLLRKFFLRQSWQIRPSYLIAIHGVAGIWGAIAVALFGTEESFATPNFTQLVTQLQGIAAAIAYSIAMAYLALFLLAFRKKAQPAQE
jgi:Amt family ammonium transporter